MPIFRNIAACALAATLASCASPTVASVGPIRSIAASKRVAAPSFSGASLLDAGTVSSALVAGKVALINFWASDCGPCLRETPLLVSVWKKYKDRVVFVGIDTKETQRARAAEFARSMGALYPHVYDPAAQNAGGFDVRYLPATVIIDARGKIAARHIGAIEFARDIESILDAELAR